MRDHTRDQNDVYVEAGEAPDTQRSFSVRQIAKAFGVDPERVERALAGEFDLGPEGRIDARMAYHLSEVLLGDLPMDRREAALMQLGGYAPRRDAAEGIGHGPASEESDRLSAVVSVPDDELASTRSSYDPATQNAK